MCIRVQTMSNRMSYRKLFFLCVGGLISHEYVRRLLYQNAHF